MAQPFRIVIAAVAAQVVSGARIKHQQFQSILQDHSNSSTASDILNLEAHLPLCDSTIVAETCKGTFGRDSADGMVAASDLQEMLAATTGAVQGLWKEFGFAEGSEVSCTDLCRQSVEVLKRWRICPPKSDVGCYLVGRRHRENIVCDVDTRPETIKDVSTAKGDLPDFHDLNKTKLLADASLFEGDDEKPHKKYHIDYSVKVAVRRTANLFRIYPATLTTVEMVADDEEVYEVEHRTPEQKADSGASAMVEKKHEAVYESSDGCTPSVCTAGGITSCTKYPASCRDCAICKSPSVPAPAPAPTFSSPCTLTLQQVTLTTGEKGISLEAKCTAAVQAPKLSFSGSRANSPKYADENFNDLTAAGTYNILTVSLADMQCYTFTFSGRSGTASFTVVQKAPCTGAVPAPAPAPARPVAPAPAPVPGTASAWKTQIQRVNVQAVAYVQTALRKFRVQDTKAAIAKWYGANAVNDETLKRRLLMILNSVDAMLGNVEYAMGPQCQSSTYAYVYPKAYTDCTADQLGSRACTKNTAGQFVFYICDLTLKSAVGEQIETLTHEGSHHATALTNDVDFQGGTAYGRSACMALAKASPSKAVENADNFCYYVQDVTDGA